MQVGGTEPRQLPALRKDKTIAEVSGLEYFAFEMRIEAPPMVARIIHIYLRGITVSRSNTLV